MPPKEFETNLRKQPLAAKKNITLGKFKTAVP